MHKNSLCVVVPAFNEENGIENCVKSILAVISYLPRTKLLVVNDGSSDSTVNILYDLKIHHQKQFSFVSHRTNQGYGAALSTGARKAFHMGYSHVLYMDSDLTNDPHDILKFYKFIDNADIDCVKASRFMHSSGMAEVPLKRQLFSISGNIVARNCFRLGIKDCTNGFRMVKTRLLHNIRLSERGFSSILEELYELKKLKATFVEVPVILTSRTNTQSNFRYSWKTLSNYGKYALKALFI